MNLDPLDIGGSVVGPIIRGVIIFLLTGFVGVVIGNFCTSFTDWEDFLDLTNAIPDFNSDIWQVILYWPLFIPLIYGATMPLAFALFIYTFFCSLFSDLLPVFSLVLVAMTCTLSLVIDENSPVSWCVFAFVFVGYTALGWIVAKRDHEEKIESLSGLFKRGVGSENPDERRNKTTRPPKKVGPKAWGEKVELEDEEWENK